MPRYIHLLILLTLFQIASCTKTPTSPIWNGSADTSWYTTADTSATEFTITTAEQLAGLAKLVNDGNDFKGKTINLGANIMLNDTTDWQNWAKKKPKNKWKPIGTYINSKISFPHFDHLFSSMLDAIFNAILIEPLGLGSKELYFRGTFGGNGFVVSGMYVKDSEHYKGLFGYVVDGELRNLGVRSSHIKGNGNIGCLAGRVRNSTISNSYSTCTVIGKDMYAGGLVGYADQSTISNSYSIGMSTGNNKKYSMTGGLVGYIIGGSKIINSYSVTGKRVVGGLVGKVQGPDNKSEGIIHSYYDSQTSGQSDTGKGVGKTTAEMQSMEFTDSLNLIAGLLSMNAWIYSPGKYPVLSGQVAQTDTSRFFADGDGTEANPYMISTKKQFEDFSFLVNSGVNFLGKHIKLNQNISVRDTANRQWIPIGNIFNPFQGTFDGNEFAVSGVYINDSSKNSQGLFRVLGCSGTIKNFGATSLYIKGGWKTGGLVGHSTGTIANSYSEGEIIGTEVVGGLVGNNEGGIIINSYSKGMVTGNEYVGGLAGKNSDNYVSGSRLEGTISGSYFTGKVKGKEYVGELVGKGN